MTKTRFLCLIAIVALTVALILTGCSVNPEAKGEGYVEVTDVRVPLARIHLSPSGSTAEYQLKPSVYPENATNKLLKYYISPEVTEFFSVSESGLVTAKKTTTEFNDSGKKAYIKIYSTSNTKAFVEVEVIVETVAVKSIKFADGDGEAISDFNVLYNSADVQLNLKYEPAHATDGREVRFISQNTNIVTVDTFSGVMRVVNVGIVTIIASGTTIEGVTSQAILHVTVSYASGKYRLEVTNQDARFDRVIGDEQKISFNIIRLDPHSDPAPNIKWFVGQARVPAQDNEWKFEYCPTEDTPSSFKIFVEITPKNEQVMRLESQPITLYWNFSGFTVNLDEPSSDRYVYGETAVLSPSLGANNAEDYEWYIRTKGEKGYGEYLGKTSASQDGGKLNYTVNREGSQTVTVLGKIGNTVVGRTEIGMNIVRYSLGDKIIAVPVTKPNEKIPESYDWFIYPYNPALPEGHRIVGSGEFFGTTAGNSNIVYKAVSQGLFVFKCIPTVGGKPMTQIINGESVTAEEYSAVFKVGTASEECNIRDVYVDGAEYNKNVMTMVAWSAVAGVKDFIVEIECDGKAYIIKTAEGNKNSYGAIVRNRSVLIPAAIVPLTKNIKVRVKQNGSGFSAEYIYTASSVPAAGYGYLSETGFSEGINGSIRNIGELGALINYVYYNRPLSMRRSQTALDETYAVKIFTSLEYSSLNPVLYPVLKANPNTGASDELKNIFNLVYAAVNAYCDEDIKNLGINKIDAYSFELLLTFGLNGAEHLYEADSAVYENRSENLDKTSDSRPGSYTEFNITLKEGQSAETAEQLYLIAERGMYPVPVAGSEADRIYKIAVSVLNGILSETMGQREKVLAIYNYLASEIAFDARVYALGLLPSPPPDLHDYDSYHITGVFEHKKALPEGIAKAFNLMCWMEGITSLRVKGTKGGEVRFWNKVYVEDKWYNADAAAGRMQVQGSAPYFAVNHAFCLVSDAFLASAGYVTYGDYPVCGKNLNTEPNFIQSVAVCGLAELSTVIAGFAGAQSVNKASYYIATAATAAEFNEAAVTAGLSSYSVTKTAGGFVLTVSK